MTLKKASSCFLFSIILVVQACGANNDSKNSISETSSDISPSNELNLIGGKTLNSAKFPGVGRTYNVVDESKVCTLTRIGERHFLTASHCVVGYLNDPSSPSSLALQSANERNGPAKKVFLLDKKHSFATAQFFPEKGDPVQALKDLRTGFEDWAVITLDHSVLENSVEIYSYIKPNFPMAKLGLSSSIHVGSSIQAAGWGANVLPNRLIAECVHKGIRTTCKDYVEFAKSDRDPAGLDNLKSANFRVDVITPKSTNNGSVILMETRLPIPKDGKILQPLRRENWGLLATGDSGGPVMNDKAEVIGVNGAIFPGFARLNTWYKTQAFTRIDKPTVDKILNRAIVDSAPTSVEANKVFVVYGYHMKQVDAYLDSVKLAKPECKPNDIAADSALITLGGLSAGEDYACFQTPVTAPTVDKIITLEEASNKDANYRITTVLKKTAKQSYWSCVTGNNYFDKDNDVLVPSGDYRWAGGGVALLKSDAIALSEKTANNWGKRFTDRSVRPKDSTGATVPWDFVSGVDCAGGNADGYGSTWAEKLADAQRIAGELVDSPIDHIYCQGPGVVHYYYRFAVYTLTPTTCEQVDGPLPTQ